MIGYFKVHRQITENEFYFCERFDKTHAWIDLLLLATHKENTLFIRGFEINLKPGQLCYSQKSLAKRWKWNVRTVNKFLKLLEKREMIHTKISNVTTIITILNWNRFQVNTYQSANQNTYQSANKQECYINDKKINRKSKVSTEKKQSLTANQQKEKIYLNWVVRLLMHYSGKDKSSSYAIARKLLGLKSEDELSYFKKCLMLMYVIKLNVEKVNEQKYVGILYNQYKELSYNIVKDQIEKQREISNELETLN